MDAEAAFSDVTLVLEDYHPLAAHKVILSATIPFSRHILNEDAPLGDQGPIYNWEQNWLGWKETPKLPQDWPVARHDICSTMSLPSTPPWARGTRGSMDIDSSHTVTVHQQRDQILFYRDPGS